MGATVTMIGTEAISRVIGKDVYDQSGDKIGSASEVYLDDESGQPEWVTVRTGLFGTKESFVPIRDADRDLTGTAGGRHDRSGEAGTVGHDTSGPTTDDAMTRSEERLDVGTRSEEVGRARLRKYVVTETETTTVPVSREEVRVEREPITDANIGNALDGPAISEEEHEVTLHAERPVVEKEAVPVERVRLDKETVQEQEQVSAELRKEEIEVDRGTGVTGRTAGGDDRSFTQ